MAAGFVNGIPLTTKGQYGDGCSGHSRWRITAFIEMRR
jgi:hypothetical protein